MHAPHDSHGSSTKQESVASYTNGEKLRNLESGSSLGGDRDRRTDSDGSVEPIRTISRVPGNTTYYEKNGLRTYGDGQDHDHEPKMGFTRFMALVAMAFLWCGSQIPVYLFGGILPTIYADIGGADIYIWAVIGNLMALAAVTPFVGALSDLFGRRWVAVAGIGFVMVGMIICSAANDMNVFIVGEVVAGVGCGISELTALAATGELAPTSKRGFYVGCMIMTIVPFTPSVLWAQLIITAPHGSWRYVGIVCSLWSFIGLVLVLVFYHPPPRPNANGLTRREVLSRIDYVGGLLITAGIVLFLAGLIWGGYQYDWTSAHVLIPVVLGGLLVVCFGLWEQYGAEYPMFPGRLKQEPRVLFLILLITFVSGANFFAVLIWWPLQSQSIYAPDPIQLGIRSLPMGFGIIAGAAIVSVLLGMLKGNIRALILGACVVMTAGTGAMAVANLDNASAVYAPIVFASIGVGGVIIPNQIIVTIICPDDLIATATALALSVRMIGGAIGFAIYYNVFKQRFTYWATQIISTPCVHAGIYNFTQINQIALDISNNIFDKTVYLYPQINTQAKYDLIVLAGRQIFALSFPIVWYTALAFGGASIVAALFLGDISKYMDEHVAVEMH